MSKIKEYLMDVRETEDYKFGWESASRGEPPPPHDNPNQHLGWSEYHSDQMSEGTEE